MFYFALGFISALLVAVFLLVVEIRFSASLVEKQAKRVAKRVGALPKGKVFVLDEVKERKEDLLKTNAEKGLETALNDLYDA